MKERVPVIEGFVFKQRLMEAMYCSLWRAEQVVLEREVLIVVLTDEVMSNAPVFRLLCSNVQMLLQLRLPLFLDVIDIFHAAGQSYVILEDNHAQNIVAMLQGRLLSVSQATRLLEAMSEAFRSMQEHGLVYGGLRPKSLFLTVDSQPVLPDLTLVRYAHGRGMNLPLEITEGMAPYVAPEVYAVDGEPDTRADMFSLAMTLYALMTGQVPFGALPPAEILVAKLEHQLPSPSDLVKGIPAGVVHVLMRMAQRNPEDRYADWDALRFDLYQLSVGVEVEAYKPEGSLILPPSRGKVRIVKGAVKRVQMSPVEQRLARRRAFRRRVRLSMVLHWVLTVLLVLVLIGMGIFLMVNAR